MRPLASLVLPALILSSCTSARADGPTLPGVRRVVFLGDSITYAGRYVEFLEAYLRAADPGLRCEFLNLGLPSETVSGLSEPGHAGGRFPRPVLRERLDRVLEQTRPDLVVACYGMNDGIYHPFDPDRFKAYQEGILELREKAEAAGARVLHLTPPVFDPVPIRGKTLPAGLAEYRQPFEGYDDVLGRYSDWLLSKRAEGWEVVDLHGPIGRFLEERRRLDPDFRLAGDGIHLDETGHWLVALQVLRHWGTPDEALVEAAGAGEVLGGIEHGPEVLRLVEQRQRLLKDAWLTATGHERPGMKAGVPLGQANRRASEIEAEILALTSPAP